MVSCKGLKVCQLLCGCSQLPSLQSRAILGGVGGSLEPSQLSVVVELTTSHCGSPSEGFLPCCWQGCYTLRLQHARHSRTCIVTLLSVLLQLLLGWIYMGGRWKHDWHVIENQCQEGERWRFSSGRGISCWLSSLSSTGFATWVLQRNKENPIYQYFAYRCGREGLNAQCCAAIRLQEARQRQY